MGRQTYTMPSANGVYTFNAAHQNHGCHQLSCESDGGQGTITVKLLAPGSNTYESFDNNIFNMSNYQSIMLTFCVSKYQFTLSGLTGGSNLIITDSIVQV